VALPFGANKLTGSYNFSMLAKFLVLNFMQTV
jgi:hypothetical protein